MMRCVLAASDDSAEAHAAVETAIELARSFGPDARLHVASVIDYAGVPDVMAKQPEGAPDLLAEQSDAALQHAAAAAAQAGMPLQTHALSGDVVDALLECADAIGADVIVAGYHGRNRLARLVMGSIAGRLVRSSHLPVLIVGRRGGSEERPNTAP